MIANEQDSASESERPASIKVALTFDAEHPGNMHCPPGNAERIIDVLAERNIRATFFMQGHWVQAYPKTARSIEQAGHLVGNHSFYHCRMPLLSAEGIRADIHYSDARIRDILQVDAKPWFRCPYGDGHDSPRVLDALGDLGYRNVHWDVAAYDGQVYQTAQRLISRVVGGVRAKGDESIVLMHTWPASTLQALPTAIRRLEDMGAKFLTVADLMPR
jgi:peptidoglycan/xylan/chitin deacetylase (PgdA/CDA1 family)